MEEKKAAIPALISENFRFTAPDPEPVLLPTERPEPRRRPLSTCLLFLLLGVFVFILGCFAVYAATSMGSSQMNGAENNLKSLPLEQPEDIFPSNELNNNKIIKPFFQFEIEVNGKKFSGTGDARNKTEIVITHTDKPKELDEFSTIKNFIKKITGANHQNIFKSTVGSQNPSESISKPKVISIESFEVRKLPSDISVNFHPLEMLDHFPFDDVLDNLLNPIPSRPKISVPQKKENSKKEDTKVQKNENSNTKITFPDFDDILSEIFDEKPKTAPKNKTKSIPPKPFFPNIEIFDPFSFPLGFSNKAKPEIMTDRKPREESNIFINKNKPYLDRYANEKKPNDIDFLSSFLGLNPFNPKKLSEDPEIFFYNIPFGQPKFPKKYQSKTLNNDNKEIIKENNSNKMEYEGTVSTTPTPIQEKIESKSSPTLPPNESSAPKKEKNIYF